MSEIKKKALYKNTRLVKRGSFFTPDEYADDWVEVEVLAEGTGRYPKGMGDWSPMVSYIVKLPDGTIKDVWYFELRFI